MKITGNTILITGGSSGIGLALAKDFLQAGNKIIITGRDLNKLLLIKNEHPEISTFQCDLSNKTDIEGLVGFLEKGHPALNIIINNAAIQYNYSFIDDANAVEKTVYEINTNLTAPVILNALLLPTLLKNGESAIVNVSSGLMISPKKSASVYCATKAAIHSYTKTLRYQLEGTSVKVFEIIPPLVETPMTAGRGKTKKISPEQLSASFIRSFKANRYEVYIGKSKLLRFVKRISPSLSDKIMKNGI